MEAARDLATRLSAALSACVKVRRVAVAEVAAAVAVELLARKGALGVEPLSELRFA